MIKIYLMEIGWEFVGWIHLTQNRDSFEQCNEQSENAECWLFI